MNKQKILYYKKAKQAKIQKLKKTKMIINNNQKIYNLKRMKKI